jgi:hypothetical protein
MSRLATVLAGLFLALGCPAFAADQPLAARRALERKLQDIVLPRVAFEEATVKEVFQALRLQVQNLDLDDRHPVNLVYQCKPEVLAQQVTMDLTNVPLGEALRYICMGTGLGYRVEDYAIVIGDSEADRARMQTRVFYVDPSMPFARGAKAAKDKPDFKGEKN